MSDIAAVLEQLPSLDEQDYKQLISALVEGEDRPFSDGELKAFCSWCEGQFIGAILVGLCLSGDIKPKWSPKEDDWVWSKR